MTPLRELYEEFVREKTKKRFAKRIGLPAPPSQIPVVWKVGDCSCDPAKRRNVMPAVCLTQLK